MLKAVLLLLKKRRLNMSHNLNDIFLEYHYEVGLSLGLSHEEAIEYANKKFDESN